MSIVKLKTATKTPETGDDAVRETVARMIAEIETGREEKAREYARTLDGWEDEIVVSKETIARAAEKVPQALKDDIRFAYDRVRGFAEAQLGSMKDVEIELFPGLRTGQKLIPMDTAGCYVPGGRYSHVASVLMSGLVEWGGPDEGSHLETQPYPYRGDGPLLHHALRVL